MAGRSPIIIIAFAAGAAIFALAPGLSTSVQRVAGIGPQEKTNVTKSAATEASSDVLRMDDERIKLAQIQLSKLGAATIARRLAVPGTIVPDASRVAHISVKLSGTVAELRKNIGDDVVKDEVLAVVESREVADAKSEYLAARLANELQQDLTARDKSLWEGRAVPEQQYIRSRNAAAQTTMRLSIARQKLLALGVRDDEIAALPQAPDASLRSQNVRAPISGRVAERRVELGTAVELSVASADLPLIKEGQQVNISARGLSETTIGKIIFVSPLVDKETRTARVVAEIENAGRTWRPGSFITAAIALNERKVPVAIPTTALQKIGGYPIVFVRTKEGFEKRDVALGQKEDQSVEVISGLTAGETIAVSNTFSLKAELSKPRDED
jgi:cobalt-zinc-cadmium efflux system membrane fusion protein